ncbi:MAG: hypothetical protein RLP44_09675 [Aggregatilineales bacterium]
MRRQVIRQGVVIATFILTIVVNALSTTLPLNGQTPAEISDRFPVLVTPANYVFGIWSIIYIGLTVFVIYQALPSQRDNPLIKRISYLFAGVNLANAAWIFSWHYEYFALSVLIMLTLLALLIAIYIRLDNRGKDLSRWQNWIIKAPFSIYLGWITVATIANISTTLYDAGWNGFGFSDVTWAVIMLIVAGVVASILVLTRTDFLYAAVIIWALVGIIAKQSDTSAVVNTAAIMIIVIAVALVTRFVGNWRVDHNLLTQHT